MNEETEIVVQEDSGCPTEIILDLAIAIEKISKGDSSSCLVVVDKMYALLNAELDIQLEQHKEFSEKFWAHRRRETIKANNATNIKPLKGI